MKQWHAAPGIEGDVGVAEKMRAKKCCGALVQHGGDERKGAVADAERVALSEGVKIGVKVGPLNVQSEIAPGDGVEFLIRLDRKIFQIGGDKEDGVAEFWPETPQMFQCPGLRGGEIEMMVGFAE